MNISIIEPVGGHGGMNYYDFSLAYGLSHAGCLVSVYTCDETNPPNNNAINMFPVFKGIYGASNKYYRGLKYIKGLIVSLVNSRKRKATICHFHFFHSGVIELLTVLLARLSWFKVVITVHDIESFAGNSSRGAIKLISMLANGLIVHNFVSKSELIKLIGFKYKDLFVIPHGNYLDYICVLDSLECKKTIGIDPKYKVILFFGQIKVVKGLDLLIRAVAEIVKEHPNIRLVIAGKVWKDDFRVYQDLIDQLGLNDKILAHIKYIADEDVHKYYSAADVVVLPYRNIYQSGVLLMSMSYAKTVLTSDLPGMTEIVDDNVNGFTFKTDDYLDLAEKLKYMFRSPHLALSASLNAKKHMVEKHNWIDIGQKTKSCYQKISK